MCYLQSVAEKVVYKVSEEDPNKTIAIRSATIDSQVFGFARAIQSFGLERFKKNCVKAINGFDHVLHSMFPHSQQQRIEGFTHNMNLMVPKINNTGKLKEAAKKATDLAKTKTAFPKVESI